MGNLLSSLPKTVHASLALAVIFFLGLFYGNGGFDFDTIFWSWLTRFIHVTVAIMWIGLLWYFNFVQIPNMPKIPDEQKPAIGKVIAPAALFYFRYAALLTVLSGLILAYLNGYLHNAMTLGGGGKNTFLIKRIATAINQEVILSNDLGYDIQAIESMAFAWMGYKRINNQVMRVQLGKDKFNKGLLGSITKAIP